LTRSGPRRPRPPPHGARLSGRLREATPGERCAACRLRPAPRPEAGEGAYRLTRKDKDGKVIGDIVLRPEAETFDPKARSRARPWSGTAVITEADWKATPKSARQGGGTRHPRAGGFP
jgi:hypothetical protein